MTSAAAAPPALLQPARSAAAECERIDMRAPIPVKSEVSSAVARILDLQYITPSDTPYKHSLDIYMPETHLKSLDRGTTAAGGTGGSTSNALPVIVFVHGGGWKRFDRRNDLTGLYANVGRTFASRGYVVAVVSYRLSRLRRVHILAAYLTLSLLAGCITGVVRGSRGLSLLPGLLLAFCLPLLAAMVHMLIEATRSTGGCSHYFSRPPIRHPAHCEDVAAAVGWVATHIREYGGDDTNITLMGHSAGGHIVSMLAVNPAFYRAPSLSGAQIASRITAYVCLSGVFNADHLALRSRFQCTNVPLWPSMAFRRAWFLHPAFGPDSAQWPQAFATHLASSPTHVRSLRLPPVLLVNASNDMGLNEHTDLFQRQLLAGGASVERWELVGANHISYIVGMNRAGWAGEAFVVPRLDAFIRAAMARRGHTAMEQGATCEDGKATAGDACFSGGNIAHTAGSCTGGGLNTGAITLVVPEEHASHPSLQHHVCNPLDEMSERGGAGAMPMPPLEYSLPLPDMPAKPQVDAAVAPLPQA